VLYEMLAGDPPYTGATPQAILARKLNEPLPRISVVRQAVPPALEAVIGKALARVPADRFQTVAQFREALSVDPAAFARRQAWRRLGRRGLAAMGVVAAAAVILLGARVWYDRTSWRLTALDSNAIAVFPFRVSGADPALDQSMMDLFYAVLNGDVGPRAIEPNALLRALEAQRGRGNDLDAPLKVAAQFGAGQLLEGTVTQAGAEVAVSAWLRRVPDGAETARQSVTGVPDSIAPLVHRLARKLLGSQLGEEGERMASLDQRAPEAVDAYLAGVQAYRRAQYDRAVGHFEHAVELDSTFALAALRVYTASLLGSEQRMRRDFLRRARTFRTTFGRRDLAELDYRLVLERVDTVSTLAASLGAVRQWIAVSPEEPEAWLEYGRLLRVGGSLLRVNDWDAQSRQALDRAWELDSVTRSTATQLLYRVAWMPPSDWVRRMGRRYLSLAGSDSAAPIGERWAAALMAGDSATVRRLRLELLQGAPAYDPYLVTAVAVARGLPLDDADSIAARARLRALTSADSQNVAWYDITTGLTRGRARQVAEAQTGPFGGYWSDPDGKWDVMLAWWLGNPGFDSVAAVAVARIRERRALRPKSGVCETQLYRAATGDTVGARDSVRALASRVRKAHFLGLCSALVEALVEGHLPAGAPAPALDSLERLARLGAIDEYPWDAVLPVLVELRRRRGEYREALALARTQSSESWLVRFMPTLRRQEGELAAIVGDTAGAIRAYREYLALRTDPDPGPMADEARRVREQLAQLVGEPLKAP